MHVKHQMTDVTVIRIDWGLAQERQNATAEQVLTHLEKFHGSEFKSFLFKALDDVPDKAPLHTIGFDGNEGTLLDASHRSAAETKTDIDSSEPG